MSQGHYPLLSRDIEDGFQISLFAALLHILLGGGEEAHVNLPPREAGKKGFLIRKQPKAPPEGAPLGGALNSIGLRFRLER